MNLNQSKTPKKRSWRLLLLLGVILVGGLGAIYWRVTVGPGLSSSATRILVLEDCDDDFRAPPFEDSVFTFGADAKAVTKARGFNMCQTVGGHRALAVSEDAGFFVVCENVSGGLSAFELNTGKTLWSLTNGVEFEAAAVSTNGEVYALTSTGLIYGKDTLVIDRKGNVTRQAAVGGFDLALDEGRNTLWLVGSNVTRCDLELKVLRAVNCVRWCAVSVDCAPDGSVWVAEREHPNVAGSTNRIFQLSPTGDLLNSIGLPFSPACLRVDRSDGSVWVTGGTSKQTAIHQLLNTIEKRTGRLPIGNRAHDFLTRHRGLPRTHKYDRHAVLLCDINQGGFTLDIDPTNGSVWISAEDRVLNYSREGSRLGRSARLSPNQRYVVVIPASNGPRGDR